MATSFVNDLNALANSLSGAAQSVAGLYQTRVQLETMRLQSELKAKDDEFLSRLYLDENDPNKITIDNWDTALNNHKMEQENILNDQRWKRVAGAVRTNVAPQVSGFNERFAKAMYTQERQWVQSETLGQIEVAAKNGQTEEVKNLFKSSNESRLWDDPRKAKADEMRLVTASEVSRVTRDLASGVQDQAEPVQLETGQVVDELKGTAYERAVSYINKSTDDHDAKISLLAQEKARSDAATKSFNSMIEDQMKEDIRKAGKVDIGLIRASIEDAKSSGYVNMADIKAAEARYDSYVFEQSVYPVESAISTHKQLYQEDVVPEKAETTLVNNIKAWANEPENKGNAQAQKYANDKIEEVRNYSQEHKDTETKPEDPRYYAEIEALRPYLQAATDKSPIAAASRLGKIMEQLRKDVINEQASPHLLRYATDLQVQFMGSAGPAAKETLELLNNDKDAAATFYGAVNAVGQQNSEMGKLFRRVLDGKGNANDDAVFETLTSRMMEGLKQDMKEKGFDKTKAADGMRRVAIELAETASATKVLPGAQSLEGFFGIERDLAKFYQTASSPQNTQSSIRSIYSEQYRTVEANVSSMISKKLGGQFSLMADPNNEDAYIVKAKGKQYNLTSDGKSFYLVSGKESIKLDTLKEVETASEKETLAAEAKARQSMATDSQKAQVEARLNPYGKPRK